MNDEKIELHDYQIEGIEFLIKRKCALLALDMGLGKSATTITACDKIGAKNILVICPAIVRHNWINEFDKFSENHKPIVVYKKKEIAQVSIVSFDFALDHGEELLKTKWDVLVVDESHYLKNPMAKRTKAIIGKNGIVHSAGRVWFLSGTPMGNHVGDLWTTFYTFGVTKLKYADFIKEFCDTSVNPWGGLTIHGSKKNKLKEIGEMLATIMYRKTKDDVMIELPPISYQDIIVEQVDLSVEDLQRDPKCMAYLFPMDKTKELFEKIKKEAELIKSLDEAQSFTTLHGFKLLEGIANSVSTLRVYCGLQKAIQIKEIIEEDLKQNPEKKIVIFAVHLAPISYLRDNLKEFGIRAIYGGTPDGKKQTYITNFMTKPEYRVLVCNIQSAGIGINLTAASDVYMVETAWSPNPNAQAIMRCHRKGQKNKVFVKFVSLANSIDQKITFVLRRKIKEITEVLDYAKKKEDKLTLPKPEGDLL